MNFEAPEVVNTINRTVDQFIEQEIEPLEEEYSRFLGEDREMEIVEGTGVDYRMSDEYLDVWQQVRERSAEAGIYTMHMPEEVGGEGFDITPFSMVVEHIENRNPKGFHPLIWDTGSVTPMMIPAYHDDYQRETYFDPIMSGEKISAFALTEPNHGSDAVHMETTAEKDGDKWLINGQKAFASKGPVADFLMVHARTSGEPGETDGITTFLVDTDLPGVEVSKVQRSMGGIQPARQAILNFDDCAVPERDVLGEVDEGFNNLIKWVGDGRITIAATAVGRAQWMLDQAVSYAKQRETFGQPISDYQGIQFQLADAATDVQEARLLYRWAAWKDQQGERAVKAQSMAKLRGSQVWNDVADTAIQVHGGAGYMRSLPLEAEYREARAARIYEGTDEIQKRTIAREML